jgi:hypothetical protein
MDLEFAFRRVWRSWPYRSTFPTVRADVRRDDLLPILHKSERRRGLHVAGWASQWPFVPYIAEDWDVEEAGEILEDWTGVPLAAWVQLAQGLVDDLKSDGDE